MRFWMDCVQPDLIVASAESVAEHVKIPVLEFLGFVALAVFHLPLHDPIDLEFCAVGGSRRRHHGRNPVGCAFFGQWFVVGLEHLHRKRLILWMRPGWSDAGFVRFGIPPMDRHRAVLHFDGFRNLIP